MTFAFDLTVTLGLIATIAIALVGAMRVRSRAIDASISACNERLDRHEHRIHANEQALQNQPKKEDLHGLMLSISEMRGDMREMRASFQGQNQIMARLESVVSRQEDHLMRNGKA